MEREDAVGAEALVLRAFEAGFGTDDVRPWFVGAVSDRHLSFGHYAIYLQKAFSLLDHLGADRAAAVLAPWASGSCTGHARTRCPTSGGSRRRAGPRPRRPRRGARPAHHRLGRRRRRAAPGHPRRARTARAARREAPLVGSNLPLAATARFMASPRVERFVSAAATEAIHLAQRGTPLPR